MCFKEFKTNSRILASTKLHNHILLITLEEIYLYDHSGLKLEEISKNSLEERLCNVRLHHISPLKFSVDRNVYGVT